MPIEPKKKARHDQIRAKRRPQTLVVKIKTSFEQSFLKQPLLRIHDGIKSILFPRQARPKFFFALCKSVGVVPSVRKAIQEFECDGQLIQKLTVKTPAPPQTPEKQEIQKEILPKTQKSCKIILIRNAPSELSEWELRRLVPTASRIKLLPVAKQKSTNWKIVFSIATDITKISEKLNKKLPNALINIKST